MKISIRYHDQKDPAHNDVVSGRKLPQKMLLVSERSLHLAALCLFPYLFPVNPQLPLLMMN